MGWKPVGAFISEAILHIAGSKMHDYASIQLHWRKIVGSSVAKNAIPRKFENGVLKVGVKNSIWMQEMILYKYKIIAAYKKQNLPIKDIIFFLNPENDVRGNGR